MRQVISVTCGAFHSLIVGTRGSFLDPEVAGGAEEEMEISDEISDENTFDSTQIVFSFGQGIHGQLGNKKNENQAKPQFVELPRKKNLNHVLDAGAGFSVISQRPASISVSFNFIHGKKYIHTHKKITW